MHLIEQVGTGTDARPPSAWTPGRATLARRRRDDGDVSTHHSAGAVRDDLEEVFRRAYPRVVAVAARVLGSSDEAEDVAQEVFLAFGRTSVPAGAALGWLSVAAAHTALNHIRAQRRRTTREEVAGRATGPTPDVVDAVVTLEERRRVRAALGRLPRKQAVALVLRHSGLSYAEVASAMTLSPASVGTTVRRAEDALLKELKRDARSH